MSRDVRWVLVLVALTVAPAGLDAQLVDRTREGGEIAPARRNLTPERRADIFMARKMYREAEDAYREAITNEPGSARLLNKLGISYHQRMLLDSARRHYERAWKTDNTYSQALNNLGTVHHAQGNYRRASRTYKRALKVSPYSASIFSNLGTSFFARGRYKDASNAYRQALELDPDVFETSGSFGTLLQERSVGNVGKYHYFMAKAYAGIEAWDRAILHIRKALEEGYGSARRVASEPAFAGMHELPEFQRIAFPETIASAATGQVAR